MEDNTPKWPSAAEIQAAAEVLDAAGRFYRWWPDTVPRYENLDPIGKTEFEAIVVDMLVAATQQRPG